MSSELLLSKTAQMPGSSAVNARRLARAMTTRTLQRGDKLWSAGDQPRAFTVVQAGLIKEVRPGRRLGDAKCTLCGPGSSVGELARLEQVPYATDAIVATDF